MIWRAIFKRFLVCFLLLGLGLELGGCAGLVTVNLPDEYKGQKMREDPPPDSIPAEKPPEP